MIVEMIRDEKGRFLKSAYPKLNISPCIFCGAKTSLEQNAGTPPWGGSIYLGNIFWVQWLECGARGPELDKEHALSEWELIAGSQ